MTVGATIISRNDNYGGNLKQRATYCLNSMIRSFDQVIYVDWNSPDRDLIEEIKDDLIQEGKLQYIVVSPALASELVNNPEAQNCVEVLARNIGIRRLSTDYKVSTNIDIIAFNAKNYLRGLDNNTFYTIARRNMELEEVQRLGGYSDIESIQDYLMRNFRNISGVGPSAACAGDRWSLINCCGDFQLAHKDVWDKIRGYEESLVYRGFADTNVQRKADFYGYRLEAISSRPIIHINHGSSFGGTSSKVNDIKAAILNFNGTTNKETWGFSDYDFKIKVI